jgi:hypothetical protein
MYVLSELANQSENRTCDTDSLAGFLLDKLDQDPVTDFEDFAQCLR